MCDYSLYGIANRLAEEGEVLALSSEKAGVREKVHSAGWRSHA